MFKIILLHDLAFWRENPLPYIFGLLLFAICFLTMWGMASEATSGSDVIIQNSESRIQYLISTIGQLLIFMLPGIIGTSIYRDFNSGIDSFLYSYPFAKRHYLPAKFLSSFLVLSIISFMIALGLYAGTLMPGIDPTALNDTGLLTYVKLFGLFLVPNLFLLSAVVFCLVAQTRNIYTGFIAVIIIFVLASIADLLSGPVGAIVDPFGDNAILSTTKFWTLADRNSKVLPLSNLLLANRMLWTVLSILGLFYFYSRFELRLFSSSAKKRRQADKDTFALFKGIEKVNIPEVNYNFSWYQRLKTAWRLSNADLKFIIISWPFASILLVGFILVYIQQSGMSPQHGVPILPTTSEMLRIPVFIFSGVFNLLTFLYSGVIIYRGKNTKMSSLIDICPQPNAFLMTTRLLAVLKMQLVLLTLLMLSGILVQVTQGYFRIEIGHYMFELYLIQFLHFSIWACVAFFIHVLFNNMYISFLVMVMLPLGVIMMPGAAVFLKMPILGESILHFNQVPGLFVGFAYSDFNQYGSMLPMYFFYKFYWSLGAIVFLILCRLCWKRGFTYSWSERMKVLKARFSRTQIAILSVVIVSFIAMGFNVYHQEHHVSKVFFTQEDEDWVYVQNEIRYAHLLDYPQPKPCAARLNMDIYPEQKNYRVSGYLSYVNKINTAIDTLLIGTSFKDSVYMQLDRPARLLSKDDQLHYNLYLLDQPLQHGDSINLYVEIQNYANSLLHDNSRVNSNGTYITGRILPTLGVREIFLSNPGKRKKYGLGERKIRDKLPSDSTLLGHEFAANNMDKIQFETIVSTTASQTALSIGSLISFEQEEGRNIYHYKSQGPIKSTMSWISGEYLVDQDSLLNIYHHPFHNENIQHLREGALSSKDYCEAWFGPLQHAQLSMIEFPIVEGTHATLNGNLIPVSEAIMLCDIDHEKNEEYNHPFFVAAHELVHYWWGHQLDPANVKGSKILTESVAEYISKKVIEDRFGLAVIRENRSKQQDTYFEIRAKESREVALNQAGLEQDYLNYVKGGLALTTIAEYIGEAKLNGALSSFFRRYANTEPPYATSLNFIDSIRAIVPDSLNYLVHDLFESITIYDLEVMDADQNGTEVNVEFKVEKYRSDAAGHREKVNDFTDYVQIALVSSDKDEQIILTKAKPGLNKVNFKSSQSIESVVINPNILLLDALKTDNVFTLN